MSIFNALKRLFANPPQTKEVANPKKSNRSELPIIKNRYMNSIKKKRFQQITTLSLTDVQHPSWEVFFSVAKTNPKLIGFENRSRRKFRHLFHNENILIAEASGTFEILTKNQARQITVKDTPFEKIRSIDANEKGILLHSKEKVAVLNILTNKTYLFEFKWQPFTFAMGNEFWLVGTRETYEGPGELYCFNYDGELRWAVEFTEKFSTVFGELVFMPYKLSVSSDSTDILVGSMDRLYRLDIEGQLKARIAISELKEKELQQKHNKLQDKLNNQLSKQEDVQNTYAEQLAYQFTNSMDRMFFNSPYAGFAHDPQTDMLFILEEKGRVSAWDKKGELSWVNTFKNDGRFIDWVDDKLIISFQTGETFWINREGEFIYGAKLPNQAATISMIPKQAKYLVVCEDNRLYELEKGTGTLIKGSDGHPGMTLFEFAGQNVFFDGVKNQLGYFWLAPEEHLWSHFEAKNISDVDGNQLDNWVSVEIAETTKFTKTQVIESKGQGMGNRVVDVLNKRIYTVVNCPRKSMDELMKLTSKQKDKEYLKHDLTCFNFNGEVLWKNQLLSSMRSLYLSPDGKTIFTSSPKETEITYYPGELLTYSNEGKKLNKFNVNAQGFDMDFVFEDTALIRFAAESGQSYETGVFKKDDKGKWQLTVGKHELLEEKQLFGAGLNQVKTKQFNLVRTDKKKYELSTNEATIDLKLTAAIYEAYETLDNQLVIRVGTRVVSVYNKELEKILEIKETENIQSFSIGSSTLLVLTKGEAKAYDFKGKIRWKYNSIPKTSETKGTWYPNTNVYLWIVSNNKERLVASITEEGKVVNSHSFDAREYHRSIDTDANDNMFIAQTNEKIELYKV